MKLIHLLFLLISSNLVASEIQYKIGLGSCNNQNYPTPAWDALEDENLDAFFFLGDNVYGDIPSGELDYLKQSYELFDSVMPSWLKETELLVIWDDHDFGLNDGGASYKYRSQSQELFNDFWNIPQADVRRSREGIYFSTTKLISGKKVLIIGLDTRYFRSDLVKKDGAYQKNTDPDSTILGTEQWNWLKDELSQPHDILILATSIQLLATEHRFEKWSNFPQERAKLISMLEKLDSTILIVSGDRHRGGIYQKGNLIEITASSLNRGLPPYPETDKLLVGETHVVHNYGVIEFTNANMNVVLRDEEKNVLEFIKIPFK
tara:strand:- start:453 stop:1409 length:957 start_codon:yes stop_codon:yes gene_type:complete